MVHVCGSRFPKHEKEKDLSVASNFNGALYFFTTTSMRRVPYEERETLKALFGLGQLFWHGL
jgi:hypothetical protein